MIKKNDVILFQGDSITDASRDYHDRQHLGLGYAMMVANWYTAAHPEQHVTFLNRGVSGNGICDMANRWQEDCLDLQPTMVSVLIGINDCWTRADRQPTPSALFEEKYREILTKLKKERDVKLVLCEPFVLPYPEDVAVSRPLLNEKIHIVRRLARDYQARLLSLDDIFAEATSKRDSFLWSEDGVHPTGVGHALIAQNWLKAMP